MVKEVDSRRAPRERARGKSEGARSKRGRAVVVLVVSKCGGICLWAGDWVLGRGLGVGEVQGGDWI